MRLLLARLPGASSIEALPRRTSKQLQDLFASNGSKLDCLRKSSGSFCAPTDITRWCRPIPKKVRCRR